MTGCTIDAPLRIASVANLREHWSKRALRARDHRLTARLLVLSRRNSGQVPALPLTVRLIRVGARRLDSDNLASALKATRDGVADALGIDDGDPRISWEYSQVQSSGYGLRIVIQARG